MEKGSGGFSFGVLEKAGGGGWGGGTGRRRVSRGRRSCSVGGGRGDVSGPVWRGGVGRVWDSRIGRESWSWTGGRVGSRRSREV
jgi:hypothetical protein